MSGEGLAGQAGAEQPGLILQRAREAAGITQREIADALHLPISTIEAIEQDDQAQLPAEVFTKGYVRAYAKLLEIDADPLVGALTPEAGEAQDDESAEGESDPAATGLDLQQLLRQPMALVGVAAVLVALVLLVVFGGGDEPAGTVASGALRSGEVATSESAEEPLPASQRTNPATPSVETAADADVVETRAESRETVSQTTDPATTASTPARSTVTSDATAPQEDAPSVDIEPIAVAQVTDPAATVRRLTPTGDDRLALVFSEDCWVEIKDAAGGKLYGDLGRAGQSIEFVGSGPFRVLLGYAPGVVLRYNAEPIALMPHTRNNVANLVLGQ